MDISEEKIQQTLSKTTLIARFVDAEELKGLPENQVDILMSKNIPIRAYTTVEFLPLEQDAMDGVFYILPNGNAYYLENGIWQNVAGMNTRIVDQLPIAGDPQTIYFMRNPDPRSLNDYIEYMYLDGKWETLGSATEKPHLYTFEKTSDGWQVKQDGVLTFTYDEQKDHIVVKKLPTTGIKTGKEYVLIDKDGNFVASYVYNAKYGWIQTSEAAKETIAHKFVKKLPAVGEAGTEYIVLTDLTDSSTYQGTFVWNEDASEFQQTSGDNVDISKEADNIIEMKADGLYATTDGGEI